MSRSPNEHQRRTSCDRDEQRRLLTDEGSTFIELLIAIVLLGTTVLAVLVALQAATVASKVDADHARAFILLHEASDAVFVQKRSPCAVAGDYESELTTLTRPEGWSSVTPVITKIEFLNADDSSGDTVYSWGNICQEGLTDSDGNPTPLKSQKVTIQVTSPTGSFSKVIETVKR